jgi:hypothetical protein
MKTMKPHCKTFPHFQLLARILLAALAVLALSTARTFAAAVNATYSTGAEVPVSSNGFTAIGKTVNLTLNFAPAPGSQLMVVRNTGPGVIIGTFSNLTQGQIVELSFRGVTYHFVANYHGGAGNDLVLLWTNDEKTLPAATLKKLDTQIVLALKQSRGEPPFDKPTSFEPNIPIKHAGRVLVDIEASVSRQLLDQIAVVGGEVNKGSETATSFRAMVPLSQLETLAVRADVKSISPARLTITSRVKVSPAR